MQRRSALRHLAVLVAPAHQGKVLHCTPPRREVVFEVESLPDGPARVARRKPRHVPIQRERLDEASAIGGGGEPGEAHGRRGVGGGEDREVQRAAKARHKRRWRTGAGEARGRRRGGAGGEDGGWADDAAEGEEVGLPLREEERGGPHALGEGVGVEVALLRPCKESRGVILIVYLYILIMSLYIEKHSTLWTIEEEIGRRGMDLVGRLGSVLVCPYKGRIMMMAKIVKGSGKLVRICTKRFIGLPGFKCRRGATAQRVTLSSRLKTIYQIAA